MLGFVVPFLVMKLGQNSVIPLIVAVTILFVASEILRMKGRSFPVIGWFTRRAAKPEELRSYVLTPIYFALGVLIPLVLFSQPFSFAAIAVLTLGDGTSSLVGSRFGRRPLLFNTRKSLEGMLSGLLAGFVGAAVFAPPLTALTGAIVGAFFEALPLPVDDNLTVPISSGLAMSVVFWAS